MNADFSLAGQVALVTGASSGLGRAFAEFLADAGASVVLAARQADKCAEASNEIGGETLPVEINVTDPVSIDAALKAAEKAFGPVNILINNAGTVTNDALVDTPPEDWRQVTDTNLTGCFLMTQAVSKRLIAARAGGRIVNISSMLGITPGGRGPCLCGVEGRDQPANPDVGAGTGAAWHFGERHRTGIYRN